MQENSSMAERGQREEMKQKASPCPRERRRDSKTGNRSGVKSEENKRYACKGSQSPAVYHAKVTKKKVETTYADNSEPCRNRISRHDPTHATHS